MTPFRIALLFITATRLASPAESEPAKFYKLDFTVKEIEGAKTVSARTYSLTSGTGNERCSIRTGSKIPVDVNGGRFLEVGVNLDVNRINEVGSKLQMNVSAEISNTLQENTSDKGAYPVIRQNRWNSTVSVSVSKPTVIFASDEVTGKRQTVVELTATPIR